MLKKIALTALFAITFATSLGVARASTKMKAPTAPVPHGLCPGGCCL